MSITTLTSLEITHYSYLLQFASDVITICAYLQILQNAAALITKCVGWIYYKMLHSLFQNAHIITKCRNHYYKMRNVLQIASLLQNAAEHCKHFNAFQYFVDTEIKLFSVAFYPWL